MNGECDSVRRELQNLRYDLEYKIDALQREVYRLESKVESFQYQPNELYEFVNDLRNNP